MRPEEIDRCVALSGEAWKLVEALAESDWGEMSYVKLTIQAQGLLRQRRDLVAQAILSSED